MTMREADAVVRAVADEHGVPVDAIISRDRDGFASRARRCACVRLRMRGLSWPDIGIVLNRHHTTIMHHVDTWVDSL